jgi:hypothetical protein
LRESGDAPPPHLNGEEEESEKLREREILEEHVYTPPAILHKDAP